MSTLLGTDTDEIIVPGTISPTVIALAGPLNVGGDADVIIAGGGNDRVNGGGGNDTMLLGSGNDTAIWNPGDGSDVVDGGAGSDTMEFNGSGANERMLIGPLTDGIVQLTRDVGNINMTLQNMERVVVNAGGGDDLLETRGNLATLVQLTLDGGAGNDRILGGNGADLLLGGDGNDFVDGQQGNDVALLGAGDDVFQWDAGDGSDVVEGQAGTDTMLFNGSNVGEIFSVAANGTRASFTRNVANIRMDLSDVERIDLRALDGVDTLLINDLSATDVDLVAVDLAEAADAADTVRLQQRGGDSIDFASGGTKLVATGLGTRVEVANAGALDQVVANGVTGAVDTVNIQGASTGDTIRLTSSAASISVSGLAANVAMQNSETGDRLIVNGNAGDDIIDAVGNFVGAAALTLDGGAGKDRILGSNTNDQLLGGAGNDFIDGQQGNDVAFLGAGNDVFQWDPGDGSDVIDGQSGFDTHVFNGANVGENITLGAGGKDVLLTRNVGNIVMDQLNVERVELFARGGSDNLEIGELRDTDVREVLVDLTGTAGGAAGDGVQDTVTVNAGARSESLSITASGDDILVNGLANQMRIANTDVADDIVVRGAGGADLIDASSVAANAADLTLDGGSGNDVLIAGGGDTTLLGGAGNDLLVGNVGDDTLNAGGGSDFLFGGGGNDLFVGDDDFTIIDFRGGAGTDDRIDLRNAAGIDDFGDVVTSARSVIGGVVLEFGDDEITLLGLNVSQLHADDFLI